VFTQHLSAKQVQVRVADALPGVFAVIPDEAIPRLNQASLGREPASNLSYSPRQFGCGAEQLWQGLKVLDGDHQQVMADSARSGAKATTSESRCIIVSGSLPLMTRHMTQPGRDDP